MSSGDGRGQAVVAGASSAIGTAVARLLAARGFTPVLLGRDQQRLAAAARACEPAAARWRSLDVTDHRALLTTVHDAAERGPITAAVWAVGLFDWAPTHRADPARWSAVLSTNLTAAAVFATAISPHLIEATPAYLILIGSGADHTAHANNAAYVASKHGLAGLTEAMFLDLRGHGVKVSLISPGLVAAGAGLQSAQGKAAPHLLLAPSDIAAAVSFVLDSSASACPTVIRLEPQQPPE
ncbi:SDR family oxidoreductase [Luteipulveratus flavus]|uniref:SDR family NAD(P)-dependent oxidoreductase n=1 Tax=Luteipulveratus flavus TaxID=3031728 RepID=A0ABT6C361_9MICO|nr:SDR family NAD(P)-dependent oxidoreductase [Luteipulveratus sp. YIM 133296]MDF8263213.1 SDR family NAD(P)-dependent oxidoreductase [Luteipulveratus sp. YIM 133296]